MANWKVWVPVGLVVVLALVFMLKQQAPAPTEYSPPGTAPETGAPPPAPQAGSAAKPGTAAADVDAAISAVLTEANDDQSAAQAEEANVDAAADNSALGDFGTAYDPNGL